MLDSKADDASAVPRPKWWKERKVSSDVHTRMVAFTHTHIPRQKETECPLLATTHMCKAHMYTPQLHCVQAGKHGNKRETQRLRKCGHRKMDTWPLAANPAGKRWAKSDSSDQGNNEVCHHSREMSPQSDSVGKKC